MSSSTYNQQNSRGVSSDHQIFSGKWNSFFNNFIRFQKKNYPENTFYCQGIELRATKTTDCEIMIWWQLWLFSWVKMGWISLLATKFRVPEKKCKRVSEIEMMQDDAKIQEKHVWHGVYCSLMFNWTRRFDLDSEFKIQKSWGQINELHSVHSGVSCVKTCKVSQKLVGKDCIGFCSQ